MRKSLIAGGVLALFGSAAMPAQSASNHYGYGAAASRILAAHNHERARVGVPPLRWDPQLAASAASYGPSLARIGGLRHSARSARPGQRENLWMGSRGAYSPERMVQYWIAEKAYFRPGMPFPHVSRTGNWADVAHYTQVVWKGTTHVGCAIHPSAKWDYLICRYSPPGNVDGRTAI